MFTFFFKFFERNTQKSYLSDSSYQKRMIFKKKYNEKSTNDCFCVNDCFLNLQEIQIATQ